ncbi:COMM domain-containing protein 2 isoform X2 [Tachypleus tridentatus]|uniref:COMM domain-containing protein 2 isoform X2 n=1 Tax=Tachypleus tridentatus TaxID=6853 RepID=UPI003FD2C518
MLKFLIVCDDRGNLCFSHYFIFPSKDICMRKTLEVEITRKILARKENKCSFVEVQGLVIVYRWYLPLVFIVGADKTENELAVYEMIQLFFDGLNAYFDTTSAMFLILDEEHKHHLNFFTTIEPQVVKELCRISLEFLQNGSNPKIYQNVAQKLGSNLETVKHAVEGLMRVLSEACKLNLSEMELQDSLSILDLQEEMKQEIVRWYVDHTVELRSALSSLNMNLLQYSSLEWRFDVQIASRCLRQQVTPMIMLKLDLCKDGKKQPVVLQTDPCNLVHLTETLEEALMEVKSQHTRRIMRNIK